jgi:alpha-mannosidase
MGIMTEAKKRATFAYIPRSHLDLFWLGNYKTCLDRGLEIIQQYIDRCRETSNETFLLDTVVFAEYFWQQRPEYRQDFIRLAQAGRLVIGAA